MKLTSWTDYSLRVLMYCAAVQERAQPVTITEISDAHGISRSHLTKVVVALSNQGLLVTTRGRGGGLRLLKPAKDILLGEVVRKSETDFTMVECFAPTDSRCRLSGHCRLMTVLQEATQSYLKVLDGVTLADLVPSATAGLPALPQRRSPVKMALPIDRAAGH